MCIYSAKIIRIDAFSYAAYLLALDKTKTPHH